MVSLGFRVRTKEGMLVTQKYLHGEPEADYPYDPRVEYKAQKTKPVTLEMAKRLMTYTGIADIVEVFCDGDHVFERKWIEGMEPIHEHKGDVRTCPQCQIEEEPPF